MLRLPARLRLCIASCMLLSACASPGYVYVAPPGVSPETLRIDTMACQEEARVVRLEEEQQTLEQRCMMDHGYTMKPAR